MIATPRELLDTSIAQLQMLTAFLGDQLADRAVEPTASDTPEIRACREILVSLAALVVKARATSRSAFGRVRSEQAGRAEMWEIVEPCPPAAAMGIGDTDHDRGGHSSRVTGA
jgi:hypothetical protein